MAEELSMLMGYGSGEDEDDQMVDDDMDGAGGKVILVGHGNEEEEGEHEDESIEDLPLLQPQPQPQPQRKMGETGEMRMDGDSPISHVNGVLAADGQTPEQQQEQNDDWLILPPELREGPPGQCNPETLENVSKVLRIRQTEGKMFSRVLQEMRAYRNPDFLEKMISHFHIKDRGSNFSTEVFDPYGLPAEDFIDFMEKQLMEARAKREQERATRKAIDFAKGGVQSCLQAPPVPKPGAALPAQAQADAQAKARQLTRRGWDK